jgi:CheY-like chemotaxis protein
MMPSSKPSLVIVDDEAPIRTSLALIFSELGHSVRTASDGFSALDLIHDVAPDILLSDLNMPGMSGFELLSVVRRIHPAIHVIATSGSFSGKSVPHGVAADAFYEKATGLNFLLDVVRQGVHSDGTVRRSSGGPTPIWMSPTGKMPSEDFYVLMGCPRCMRAFPKVLAGMEQVVCETPCLYCGTAISYAIVPTLDSAAGLGCAPVSSRGTIEVGNIQMTFDVASAGRRNNHSTVS